MRKIVAGFAASVDGYIAGIHDEYDWIIIDEKIDFGEEMKRFDAFFYGRRSYEMAKSMASKPAAGTTNYVFSNTLEDVHPDFVLLKGDVKEVVSAMKQQPGKDMAVFGGANLLASLLNLQLVDEISVSFIPVLLGSGKPMVDFLTKKVWLEFISSKRYGNGTLVVKYAVNYGG
jgi:dihydrofolate reductase